MNDGKEGKWETAVKDACTIAGELGWDENDPEGSLERLIAFHVAIAIDPKVNGGFSLQPVVVQTDNRKEFLRGRREGVRDGYKAGRAELSTENTQAALSDEQLADPEFVRAYIESQNHSFELTMAELAKARTILATRQPAPRVELDAVLLDWLGKQKHVVLTTTERGHEVYWHGKLYPENINHATNLRDALQAAKQWQEDQEPK